VATESGILKSGSWAVQRHEAKIRLVVSQSWLQVGTKPRPLSGSLKIEGRSGTIARRVRWGQVEGDSTKTEWGWRVAGVWVYGGLPQAFVVITAVEAMFRVQRRRHGLGLYGQGVSDGE
jgi:hypothetical protein